MRYPTSTPDLHNAKRDIADFLASKGLFLAAASTYEEIGDTTGAKGMVKLWEELYSQRAQTSLTKIFNGR